jgi:hypothetical protein
MNHITSQNTSESSSSSKTSTAEKSPAEEPLAEERQKEAHSHNNDSQHQNDNPKKPEGGGDGSEENGGGRGGGGGDGEGRGGGGGGEGNEGGGGGQRASSFWSKYTFEGTVVPFVGALISAAVGAAVVYFSSDIRVYFAAKAFAEKKLEFKDKKKQKHVNRDLIENKIRDLANQGCGPDRKFAVVSGRILVGKTESITSAFKDRKGVVKIKLNNADNTIDAIIEKICDECKLDDKKQFKAMMEAVNKKSDEIPVIVIEIEKAATDRLVMKHAEAFAKGCCWDNDYGCMVYIVPSDNASTELLTGGQEARYELIWVGPMSDDEAMELLEKYPGFKMGDTGIEEVDEAAKVGGKKEGYEVLFKQVGLHPGDLSGLAKALKDDRQEYVKKLEKAGSATWDDFIKLTNSSAKDHSQVVDFDYMKLGMNDLSNSLLNSGEDGVKVEDLKKISANEMKPKMVNAFMKEADNKPFIYQPRDDVYFFYDVFVERAARKWEKERKWWKLWKS